MSKSRIRLLIVVILLLLVLTPVWASNPSNTALPGSTKNYTPPTDQQLINWWSSLDRTQQLAQLRLLDTIDHAVPHVPDPRYLAVLSGRDLHLKPYYDNGLGHSTMTLGPWDYEVTWPEITLKNWAPKPKSAIPVILGAAAGGVVLGGLAVAFILH